MSEKLNEFLNRTPTEVRKDVEWYLRAAFEPLGQKK